MFDENNSITEVAVGDFYRRYLRYSVSIFGDYIIFKNIDSWYFLIKIDKPLIIKLP
jgi:hypothetical protein